MWKEKITLFKDAVAPIQDSVAPVSASWAKKHILGFSDEEIRLDLQQQRIERAVSAELGKTAEVITRTGVFDNIDSLYGKKESEKGASADTGDSGDTGGDLGSTPPPSGGDESPPPPSGGEVPTTERLVSSDLDLLLEDTLFSGKNYMNLSKGRNSLIEMDDRLKKLINK